MSDPERHIIFGIDGGGSGCRIAAIDGSGARIGEGAGGPANVTTDQQLALSNLRDAVAQLACKNGIPEVAIQFGVAHVGLAGVITQADKDAVAAALPFAHVVVTDDCETALVGALQGRCGVLAAIGTGTIIAAQSATGVRRFGGWGLQVSDQASGAWLGQEALKLCVLACDGLVAHSDLTRALFSAYSDDLTRMVNFAQSATPADYGAHAPKVIDAAKAGDTNALQIMGKGAAYLMDCLNAADLQEDDVLCLSGGVGPQYAPYLETQYQSRIAPALGTPLDGALILAKQLRDGLPQ